MAKVKLTKGELKRQRDLLRQYERYLPTLQLKKQQLQLEILRQNATVEEKKRLEEAKHRIVEAWAGLFSEQQVNMRQLLGSPKLSVGTRNVAGVDLPVFAGAEFLDIEYDLFSVPLWVDRMLEELKILISLREEIKITEEAVMILRKELRITTQRVNLFEKVKIPESLGAIKLIKIYIGDQMANAVGRSKMAKRKIQAYYEEEMLS
ncbi:MAG: V-type ATP synthase subunit D [Candidatus Omnitrophota bacterium]